MSSKTITTAILIGMILGIVLGYIVNVSAPDAETAKSIAGYFSLVTDIFLRLIKMIIAPLVFATLVAGIAHMSDTKTIGRVGLKAMIWFVSASFVSLLLGLLLVNLIRPGSNLNLPLPDINATANLRASSLNLKDFIAHLVPRSAAEAMANNEILQIVVFSIFFGVAAAAVGEKAKAIVHIIEELAHIILKVTGYVMNFAPVAVFAAMTAIIATQGLGILVTYGKFVGSFYLSLLVLWLVMGLVGFLLIGKGVVRLFTLIREPFLLAFSTASSEAAYPVTMEQLAKYPVSQRIISFVLPLGYSFNLDGSMMYCTFAALFIAQAYNIPLTLGQEMTMLLILMLTSKGMAGVPRASLVVIAAILPQFNIPDAGLLLVIGVDQFLDMGRSATNVIGNSLATVAVHKWEGAAAVVVPDEFAEIRAEPV